VRPRAKAAVCPRNAVREDQYSAEQVRCFHYWFDESPLRTRRPAQSTVEGFAARWPRLSLAARVELMCWCGFHWPALLVALREFQRERMRANTRRVRHERRRQREGRVVRRPP
jgi:hypothetical protein